MHRLVPQFILENYQAENYQGHFQAIGLLVDVTGFSKMTDVLATHGMHGSEVLANGMRNVFDPMIHSVHAYGGYVVGFAGDAITALFPAERSKNESYIKALAAALSIQEHHTNTPTFETPYGDFNIAVKIGLGAGYARWGIVKAANGMRATYYFRGSAIENAVSSLALSESGEIILCPEMHKTLGNTIKGQQKNEHLLFTNFFGDLPKQDVVNFPSPNPAYLRVFCSDEVSAHDLTGEFRPAVNLFITLPQENENEIELEPFLQQVFLLQDRYGGLFSRVDIGDKGTNLLMFWGAPVAQENDVERALNLFLDLHKVSKIQMKAGITYRLAYAGYMGGELQEEYTCYGWGVNLAARLMTAAAMGEIWTDEEIARRAGRRFSFQHMGHQKLKGFAQEQNVFKLLKRKDDEPVVFGGKFVGREAELETLRKFIGPIWSGEFAGVLTIFGEPGIGKSRLVNAFQSSDFFSENTVYWALCQSDEIVRQSLNPFRYWLKRYFSITETMDEVQRKQAFDKKLGELIASISDEEMSQSLDRRRSFLGELVDLHWRDSLYEKLDAQGRYENTTIALSTLLRVESLKQPVILLIEDLHLIDDDSLDFLQYLGRTLTADRKLNYPVAVIGTSREAIPGFTFENAPNETINLTQLPDDDLLPMAEFLLSGPVAPSLIKFLEQRTEGNPFYIEQIIYYLQEEGSLEQSIQGWQFVGQKTIEALPTDISAILISRLDRLNREVRDTVQTASVLGREFELRLLSKMLHDDEAIRDRVHRAVEEDILSTLTEIRYIFRHGLLRDAAYNMQLQARRQELHRIAGEAFETLYQDQLAPHYNEIAYHSDHAGLKEKAKMYYILAGEEAVRAYQNSLAIESYTRALALSTIDDIQERFDLLLARASIYRIIGDHNGQEQDLATLELLAEKQQNKRNSAVVALHQAEFAFAMGKIREAQLLAKDAIDLAKSADAIDIETNVYRTLPLALVRQGHIKEAFESAQTGLQLSQQVSDRDGEGKIYNLLGLITLEEKKANDARAFFEKSLVIAQETVNRRLEAQVLNNMGIISGLHENDYTTARRYYEKMIEIVQETGDRVGESYAWGNLGWVTSMQGNYDESQAFQENSLIISRETGNRYQEAYTLINLSAMLIAQENYAEALALAIQALEISNKINEQSAKAWSLTYLGYSNLGLGNYQEAANAYQKALDTHYFQQHQSLAMEPLAGLAQVELENGTLAGALSHAEKILAHLTEGSTLEGTEEPLRIYLIVYQVLTANNDPRANQILENAYSLLQDQVSKIQEQIFQKMFIQNVPWRREIEKLWKQNQEKK
jgi:predicted ATPase/class 3 adenylate cyclase